MRYRFCSGGTRSSCDISTLTQTSYGINLLENSSLQFVETELMSYRFYSVLRTVQSKRVRYRLRKRRNTIQLYCLCVEICLLARHLHKTFNTFYNKKHQQFNKTRSYKPLTYKEQGLPVTSAGALMQTVSLLIDDIRKSRGLNPFAATMSPENDQ